MIEILEGDFGPLWQRVVKHPFITAVADGSLSREAADRWLVEDHYFILCFRRFLGGLVLNCQDPAATDLLCDGFAPLRFELSLFRNAAKERGVDLTRRPSPSTVSWSSYLLSSLQDGYKTALTVLYAAERVYLEAWRSVHPWADRSTPFWPFIENWSSEPFKMWVDALGMLVRINHLDPPTQMTKNAFECVLRYELQFMNGLFAGDSW